MIVVAVVTGCASPVILAYAFPVIVALAVAVARGHCIGDGHCRIRAVDRARVGEVRTLTYALSRLVTRTMSTAGGLGFTKYIACGTKEFTSTLVTRITGPVS